MNIFRDLLKYLPEPKIEVIPEDKKDQKIAEQMTQMLNYKIKEDANIEYREGSELGNS